MILTDQTKKDFTGIGQYTSTSYDPTTSNLEDSDYGYSRTYFGHHLNGKEHGIGFYKSRGGNHLFAGEFVQNKTTGLGIKLYLNDDGTLGYDGKYCGEYKNNKWNGLGCWQFNGGVTFIGNFKNHCPTGFGVMITWEGLKFIGNVSNFLAVSGKWYDQEDNEIDIIKLGYEKDGSKFVGKIKGNTSNGIITYPDGRKYEGEFEYVESMIVGKWRIKKGRCNWTNGRFYEGEWKDGKQNGYGITVFPEGFIYEGQWTNGKAEGRGIFRFIDGSSYKGECKDDKFHGQGTFTNSKGTELSGNWEKGEFKS